MSAERIITKAELQKQIRAVQKTHPNATYAEALEINRREQLRPQRELKAASKIFNPVLHKAGLGVNRGVFMETPLEIVDGKMRYEWGKQIRYAGIGQERSATHFDGEGGFQDKVFRDGLLTAIHYANKNDLWSRPPGYYSYSLASRVRTCQACGRWFTGRNDAKTCTSKCRKKLQRANERKNRDVTLIS